MVELYPGQGCEGRSGDTFFPSAFQLHLDISDIVEDAEVMKSRMLEEFESSLHFYFLFVLMTSSEGVNREDYMLFLSMMFLVLDLLLN